MNLTSISVSYRLGLGFHALNNEGSDGSNLMQPRKIDVGSKTYDGISGEIIRRHILENFVKICREENIPMLPLSEGLHPDRGLIGIRAAAKKDNHSVLLDSNVCQSVRTAIQNCAILDVGGFLAPFAESKKDGYTLEKPFIDENCAEIVKNKEKNLDVPQPIKRESCFDVAWLISEAPQDLTITQHSAFRDTASLNSRYAQTMRSNIYGGVIRADLHRIGMDDNWYLQPGQERLSIAPAEQQKRQNALIRAILDFIAAPTGAKVAGWAPHVFLTEGAVFVAKDRTAPFVSPIKVVLSDKENPVQPNNEYKSAMAGMEDKNKTYSQAFSFGNTTTLLELESKIKTFLQNGKAE